MRMPAARGRRKPYTEIGIRRVLCFRCRKRRAVFQWNICSDGNVYRPICERCDIAMNSLVLRFMRFADRKEKLARYVRRIAI